MNIIERVVYKYYNDPEVYVRVDKPGRYVVKWVVANKIVKEKIAEAVEKRVKRGRRVYRYYYVRVMAPWSSTLRARGGA